MKKYLPYIFLVVCLLVENGIFGRFYLFYNVSLVTALVGYIAIKRDLESSLTFALISGMLVEISTFSSNIWTLAFLVLGVIMIDFFKKKYFSFNNNLSIFLAVIVFLFLRTIFYHLRTGMEFNLQHFTMVNIANFIFGFLTIIIYQDIDRLSNIYEKKNREN